MTSLSLPTTRSRSVSSRCMSGRYSVECFGFALASSPSGRCPARSSRSCRDIGRVSTPAGTVPYGRRTLRSCRRLQLHISRGHRNPRTVGGSGYCSALSSGTRFDTLAGGTSRACGLALWLAAPLAGNRRTGYARSTAYPRSFQSSCRSRSGRAIGPCARAMGGAPLQSTSRTVGRSGLSLLASIVSLDDLPKNHAANQVGFPAFALQRLGGKLNNTRRGAKCQ